MQRRWAPWLAAFALAACAEHGSDRTGGLPASDMEAGAGHPEAFCLPPRAENGAGLWLASDPDTLAPPPVELLLIGPYLICSSYRAGALDKATYRAAGLNHLATLLEAEAAVGLGMTGANDPATRTALRSWFASSAFLGVVCRAAQSPDAPASGLSPGSLDYCARLGASPATHAAARP